MKKIFLPVIIAVLMMSSSFSFAQTGINEENNTVRFNNVLTYEGYADNKTDRKNILDLYSQSTTLKTLLEAGDTTEAVPEFIKMIANSDYIFTIGDYLIKFDMANDRVLLINKNIANAYQALQNNNTNQAGMMELNNDVDNGIEILEGLENGSIKDTTYQSKINLVQGCDGAKRRTDKDDPQWSTLKIDEVDFTNLDDFCTTNGCSGDMTDYEMDNKVVYQKFVFYFRLIAKMKSGYDCAGNLGGIDPEVNKDLKGVGDATYLVRPCAPPEQNRKFDVVKYDNAMEWIPYQGSRGLNKYIVTINFSIKHTWEQTYSPAPRPLQIKYGY